MNTTRQLDAMLRRIGDMHGWTSSPLGGGYVFVSSPRGTANIKDGTSRDRGDIDAAIEQLQQLGYDQDRDRRVPPAAQPSKPAIRLASVQDPAPEPQTDTQDETESDFVTTQKSAGTRKRGKTVFLYPEDPQRLPLSTLLPPVGGDGGQRRTLPMVIVDAEIAQAFFNRRAADHNRKLRKGNKDKFLRLFEEGEIQLTHQGLAFNQRGELSDGQHRMAALIEYAQENPGATMVVDVTYNMPLKSALGFDGGANRNAVDHLLTKGHAEAVHLAPMIRFLYLYKSTEGQATRWKDIPPLSPGKLEQWTDEHGDALLEARSKLRKLSAVHMNVNIAAVCYYLAKSAWPESPIDQFVEGMVELQMEYTNDPRKALLRWLSNKDNYKYDSRRVMGNFMATYNDYCQKRPRQVVRWVPTGGIEAPFQPEGFVPKRRRASEKK
jgi:hypothetical protein